MSRRPLKPKKRRSSVKIITIECKILKFMRKKAGLSIRKAAAMCGVSEAFVNHMENGRLDWTQERGRRILEGLGFCQEQFEAYRKGEVELEGDLVEECIWEIRRMKKEAVLLVLSLIRQLKK